MSLLLPASVSDNFTLSSGSHLSDTPLPFRLEVVPGHSASCYCFYFWPNHELLANFQYFYGILLGKEDPHWVMLATELVHLLNSESQFFSPKAALPTLPTTYLIYPVPV